MFCVNAHCRITIVTSITERFEARNLRLSANYKTTLLQPYLKTVEINCQPHSHNFCNLTGRRMTRVNTQMKNWKSGEQEDGGERETSKRIKASDLIRREVSRIGEELLEANGMRIPAIVEKLV